MKCQVFDNGDHWHTFLIDDLEFDVHVGTKQAVLVLGQSEIILRFKTIDDLKEQLKVVARVYSAIFNLGSNEGKRQLRDNLKELLDVRS